MVRGAHLQRWRLGHAKFRARVMVDSMRILMMRGHTVKNFQDSTSSLLMPPFTGRRFHHLYIYCL